MVDTVFPHLIQHRNRVDGLGIVEHGIYSCVNLLILRQEKVLRLDNADHIGNTAAVNKNGAKYRLFRLQ